MKKKFAIAACCTALFLWFLPALNAYIKRHLEPQPVVTFTLAIRCRLPEQQEQVVVLVRGAGEPAQRAECVYVMSSGAYGRDR